MPPKFDVRKFNSKDHYGIILKWFEAREFPCPDLQFLPPTGCMIYLRMEPVACGFLFRTDANMAGIGHLVTNPAASKEARQPALDHVIEMLTKIARLESFGVLTVSASIPQLWPRFESMGFEKCDACVTTFRRFLCR